MSRGYPLWPAHGKGYPTGPRGQASQVSQIFPTRSVKPATVKCINISIKLKEAFELFAVAIFKLNAGSRKLGLEFVCRAHVEKSQVFGQNLTVFG